MTDMRQIAGAAADCGLHLRNWSVPGEVVFAVYQHDGYLGMVRLDGGQLHAHKHWDKKDGAHFRALSAAFAARTEAP